MIDGSLCFVFVTEEEFSEVSARAIIQAGFPGSEVSFNPGEVVIFGNGNGLNFIKVRDVISNIPGIMDISLKPPWERDRHVPPENIGSCMSVSPSEREIEKNRERTPA